MEAFIQIHLNIGYPEVYGYTEKDVCMNSHSGSKSINLLI